jgi:hypothetical protein
MNSWKGSSQVTNCGAVNFFLFPKCKLVLWGQNVGDVTMNKSEMTSLLKGLREGEFQGCFQQWKQRWDKCIVSNGKYFEGGPH